MLSCVCYHYLNFVLLVNYCFLTGCWLAHYQFSWNVLLFTCDLIGQLCLRWPQSQYSHCTLILLLMFVLSKKQCTNNWPNRLCCQCWLLKLSPSQGQWKRISSPKTKRLLPAIKWLQNAQKHVTGPLDLMMLFFCSTAPQIHCSSHGSRAR